MKQTYKTDHPTITEITIGDKFVLYNGTIVTFVEYDETYIYMNKIFPFVMSYENNIDTFDEKLKFLNVDETSSRDIKQRYIPLKDKLNLL